MQAALTQTFANQGIGQSLLGGDKSQGVKNPLGKIGEDGEIVIEETKEGECYQKLKRGEIHSHFLTPIPTPPHQTPTPSSMVGSTTQ